MIYKNWKTIENPNKHQLIIPCEEPILKYDSHHDEVVNIATGEVIQEH